MRKSLIILLTLLLSFCLLFGGCGGPDETDGLNAANPDWPGAVTLSDGPMGGPWYPFMVTYAELLTKEIPEITWTAIEGTTVGNIRAVEGGVDAQVGLAHLNIVIKAKAGELEITAGETFDNVLIGNAINCSYATPIAKVSDADIQTFQDVAEKSVRFSPGLATTGPYSLYLDLLELYGSSYEDIKKHGGSVDLVNYSEMSSLMQDGHLDVGVFCGDMPHASAMELEASTPIKILPIEEDKLAQLKERYPEITTMWVQPGEGSYSGVTEPVETPCVIASLLYSKVLPDDLIYEMTRVLMENSEALRENNPNLFYLSWEETLTGVSEETCCEPVWRAVTEGPAK